MTSPARRATSRVLLACLTVGSIAVAVSPAAAAVPENVGFHPPVAVDTGTYAYATSIADVTGDGLADLIVGNTGVASETFDYHLLVFAQGNGSLAAPAVYAPTWAQGETPSLVNAVGDLDDDGDLDVVVGTTQGLNVFLQDAGVLTGPTNYPSVAGEVFDVQIADLNGDGRDDVVYTVPVAASPGDHRVVRRSQNDLGTLDAADVLGTFAGADSVAVGDVTGDAQPDIVLEDRSGDGLRSLVQQEDLSFVAEVDDRVSGVSIAAFADLTGDGLDDLVVQRDATPGPVLVMPATSGGPLGDPVSHASGATGDLSIEAADLNGDGTDDLVVLDQQRTAIFVQGDSGALQGPCLAPAFLDGAIGGKEVTAVGDLGGDGVPDLVGGGVRLGVSLLAGFAPGKTYASSLTLAVSNVAPLLGRTITLSGELTPEMGCLDEGAKVRIWRQKASASPVVIGSAPIQETAQGFTYRFKETPPSVARFRYFATYAGKGVVGASQSPKVVVDVAKLASTLALAISDTSIRFGGSVTLRATLRGPENGAVVFAAKTDSGTRTVGTAGVNDRGVATLKVKPSVHTTYTARYAGNASYLASDSGGASVKVAAVVNGVMYGYDRMQDGIAVYECCRAWFRTWVKPAKPGQPVKLTVQYWNGLAWRLLQADKDTFKLNEKGEARIVFALPGGSGFKFRARSTWNSDGRNIGGSSAWTVFRLE